jgi:hypothetical protein
MVLAQKIGEKWAVAQSSKALHAMLFEPLP